MMRVDSADDAQFLLATHRQSIALFCCDEAEIAASRTHAAKSTLGPDVTEIAI
jgi:hypothetical protein